jgi:alkylation response protein AidB-like acyl-CoA dehydrogenase
MSEASVGRSAGFDNSDPIARARQLIPLVRAYADESERERRLAAPVVDALRAQGLFAMGLPRSLGGLETSVGTAMRAIEETSYADGATGWNVRSFNSVSIIARTLTSLGQQYEAAEAHRLAGASEQGRVRQQADL